MSRECITRARYRENPKFGFRYLSMDVSCRQVWHLGEIMARKINSAIVHEWPKIDLNALMSLGWGWKSANDRRPGPEYVLILMFKKMRRSHSGRVATGLRRKSGGLTYQPK